MKARRARVKPRPAPMPFFGGAWAVPDERVYPAESDPRQAVTNCRACGELTGMATKICVSCGSQTTDPTLVHPSVILGPARTGTAEELASEFGPWVRAEDGSWARNRRRKQKGG